MHSMRLPTTQIVVTSALEFSMKNVDYFDHFVSNSLNRFFNGDWGEMDSEDDRKQNDDALVAWQNNDEKNFNRILAVYKTELVEEEKIWIIEEYDRSVITVLYPSDY